MEIAPTLFETSGDRTWLIAARDRMTGDVRFPFPAGPEGERFEPFRLPETGRLWSWTVQRFAPKPPFLIDPLKAFRPYGVGYVQLDDVLIVEGRIIADDFAVLTLGQRMRVTTETFATSEAGEPWVTYAFKPIAEGQEQ